MAVAQLSQERLPQQRSAVDRIQNVAWHREAHPRGIRTVPTQRDQQLALFGIQRANVDAVALAPNNPKQVMLSIGQERGKDMYDLQDFFPSTVHGEPADATREI